MKDILKITLFQTEVVWLDVNANIEKLDKLIQGSAQSPDLIVLPEMFATGFVTDTRLINIQEQDFVLQWMKKAASQSGSCVAGSHPWYQNGNFYNRFLAVFPDGNFIHYDKRHLFSIGGELENYTKGNERKVFTVKGWRIMPLICYDLRFPVWSRNNLKYDILLYSASWPAKRNAAWNILLKARAVENQCYVAAVNRTGTDGNNVLHIGQSQVIDPLGEIKSGLNETEGSLIVSLDKKLLENCRKEFPVMGDADSFQLK